MWCKQCQQDVPGLASSDGGVYCCPRCNRPLRAGTADGSGTAAGGDRSTEAVSSAADGPESPPFTPRYADWESDEQLRHVQRMLGPGKPRDGAGQSAPRKQSSRVDPPHADAPAWHANRSAVSAGRAALAAERETVLPLLTWAALSVGTMALVCGGILLGWSLCSSRQDLWSIGAPVALCGQVALAVGLVLQLDRIWHNSRHAAAKLAEVDEELHELKTATTLLGTSHASPGGAFYAHMAGGAGPEVLLSDLKGQLDLLALKISKCE